MTIKTVDACATKTQRPQLPNWHVHPLAVAGLDDTGLGLATWARSSIFARLSGTASPSTTTKRTLNRAVIGTDSSAHNATI